MKLQTDIETIENKLTQIDRLHGNILFACERLAKKETKLNQVEYYLDTTICNLQNLYNYLLRIEKEL